MGHRRVARLVVASVVVPLVLGVMLLSGPAGVGSAEPDPASTEGGAMAHQLAGTAAVTAQTGTTSMAYSGDFPDPFVLVHNGTYWAYSTGSAGRDLQVMSSKDLRRWTSRKEALAGLPAWASKGLTWAPEVVPIDGRFVMYYTLRQTASALQCISVAVASTPAGPFVDSSTGPLICQPEHWGSIDPSPFVEGQNRFLLWKSDDNAGGQPTHLWAQPLSADGLSLTGTPTLLLSQTRPWQGGIIEGPSMIATGGAYVLFYGAGPWSSASAGIGYATCSSALGPCVEGSPSGPWLASRSGARGPSGPATFRDLSGALRFAHHAWPTTVGYHNGGVRALYTGRLSFVNGVPTLS
jgi:hypothetical protein